MSQAGRPGVCESTDQRACVEQRESPGAALRPYPGYKIRFASPVAGSVARASRTCETADTHAVMPTAPAQTMRLRELRALRVPRLQQRSLLLARETRAQRGLSFGRLAAKPREQIGH